MPTQAGRAVEQVIGKPIVKGVTKAAKNMRDGAKDAVSTLIKNGNKKDAFTIEGSPESWGIKASSSSSKSKRGKK